MEFNAVAEEFSAAADMIDLATGYPAFEPPDWLINRFHEETCRSALEQGDVPYGLLALRDTVSSIMATPSWSRIDPRTEVTITGSASEAITSAVLATARVGGNIVVLSPHFPVYSRAAAVARLGLRHVDLVVDHQGKYSVDLEGLVELVDGDTTALILNNPHNPTGMVLPAEALACMVRLCNERDVVLIADEVFSEMDHTGDFVSVMEIDEAWRRTIVITDTGKRFALRGHKLGYLLAGRELTSRIRAVQQLVTYRIPPSLQRVFNFALTSAPDTYDADFRKLVRENIERLAGSLRGHLPTNLRGVTHMPAAGPFVLVLTDREGEVQEWLRQSARILSVPGRAFYDGVGRPLHQFVRLSAARRPDVIGMAQVALRGAWS